MTGRQLQSGFSTAQPDSDGSGLSMAKVAMLPDAQRQIVLWMLRQGTVTAAEVAEQVGQSEVETRIFLQHLVRQGFVQEVDEGGDRRYQVNLSRLQDQQADDPVTQTLSLGKPLAVILNSSGEDAVTPGSTFTLGVTISNKGNQSAVIDIFIDDLSPILRQWSRSAQERLALGAQQSGEVLFQFDVPVDALPGNHRYLLVVDAPAHYPEDTPIQYDQQLQVLPPLQNTVRINDPTFFLQPASSAAKPVAVQPGGILQFQIFVHNRSDRVDRFRLNCLDLPSSWLNVIYPQSTQGQGLVVEADSLNLNPGEQGQIFLTVNPPLDALAGTYLPTLRLHSENNPQLMLLDLLYLQVMPIYQLQTELRTVLSRVKQQAGVFAVQLSNTGNIDREILLRVEPMEEGQTCTYTLEPSQVRVLPKQTVSAQLWVQPNPWWKRPLFGGGRLINFNVTAEDAQQLPLISPPMQGFVLWESRPWWQLLPFVLVGAGAMVSLVWLIWWLLFRPPVSPKVIQFFAEDTQYTVANNDVVRLGWEIDDPHLLRSLEVVGLSAEGKVISGPIVYDFSRGIPAALQPFCVTQQLLLTCRNLRTDARRAGEYVFTLNTIPKSGRGRVPSSARTNAVTITPLPFPELLEFTSTQPVYQEANPTPAAQASEQAMSGQAGSAPAPASTARPSTAQAANHEVRLNWAIAHPEQIREIQLIGRSPDGVITRPLQRYNFSQGIPAELQPFCAVQEGLVCQNVPTGSRQPGDYVFELTVLPTGAPAAVPIALKTDVIKIQPRSPQIAAFRINGLDTPPKYLIPVDQGQPIPSLVLSWEVLGSAGTTVQILPAPGSVPLKGAIPIPLAPEPGSFTVTLQATNSAGQQVVRSLTLETYDPTPTDPAATAAAAAAAATAAAAAAANSENTAAAGSNAAGAPAPGSPAPADPGSLSPSELPPQF